LRNKNEVKIGEVLLKKKMKNREKQKIGESFVKGVFCPVKIREKFC